jgi:CRP/FNR family cyclic AMP-dependent transcriptional regulator
MMCATFERFGVDQSIFKEGGNAEQFYLIQNGRATLDAFVPGRGVSTVQSVSAGDAFGCSWLFPPYQWHFSARASDVTEAIVFAPKRSAIKRSKNGFSR